MNGLTDLLEIYTRDAQTISKLKKNLNGYKRFLDFSKNENLRLSMPKKGLCADRNYLKFNQ